MNLTNLINLVNSLNSKLEMMQQLDPEGQEFHETKALASTDALSIRNSFLQCGETEWCEGCKCNYPEKEDGGSGSGGGGGM